MCQECVKLEERSIAERQALEGDAMIMLSVLLNDVGNTALQSVLREILFHRANTINWVHVLETIEDRMPEKIQEIGGITNP